MEATSVRGQKVGEIRSIFVEKFFKKTGKNPRHPIIPSEVWCLSYVFEVQIPSQEVFGCL